MSIKHMWRKELLGNIGVDSGVVFIGDPCYLRGEINPDDISHVIQCAWGENKNHASLPFQLGHEGAGIVSSTLDGDGYYPVYGYFKDDDKRPSKIIIDFTKSGNE